MTSQAALIEKILAGIEPELIICSERASLPTSSFFRLMGPCLNSSRMSHSSDLSMNVVISAKSPVERAVKSNPKLNHVLLESTM
jgi:hypothetical protein